MKKIILVLSSLTLIAMLGTSNTANAQQGANIVVEPFTFEFVSPCSGTDWVFTGERKIIYSRNSIVVFYAGIATEEGSGDTVPFDGVRVDVRDMSQEQARYGSNINVYGEHKLAIGRKVCKS